MNLTCAEFAVVWILICAICESGNGCQEGRSFVIHALSRLIALVSSKVEASGGIRKAPGLEMRVNMTELLSEPGFSTALLASPKLFSSAPLTNPACAVGVVNRASQRARAEPPG